MNIKNLNNFLQSKGWFNSADSLPFMYIKSVCTNNSGYNDFDINDPKELYGMLNVLASYKLDDEDLAFTAKTVIGLLKSQKKILDRKNDKVVDTMQELKNKIDGLISENKSGGGVKTRSVTFDRKKTLINLTDEIYEELLLCIGLIAFGYDNRNISDIQLNDNIIDYLRDVMSASPEKTWMKFGIGPEGLKKAINKDKKTVVAVYSRDPSTDAVLIKIGERKTLKVADGFDIDEFRKNGTYTFVDDKGEKYTVSGSLYGNEDKGVIFKVGNDSSSVSTPPRLSIIKGMRAISNGYQKGTVRSYTEDLIDTIKKHHLDEIKSMVRQNEYHGKGHTISDDEFKSFINYDSKNAGNINNYKFKMRKDADDKDNGLLSYTVRFTIVFGDKSYAETYGQSLKNLERRGLLKKYPILPPVEVLYDLFRLVTSDIQVYHDNDMEFTFGGTIEIKNESDLAELYNDLTYIGSNGFNTEFYESMADPDNNIWMKILNIGKVTAADIDLGDMPEYTPPEAEETPEETKKDQPTQFGNLGTFLRDAGVEREVDVGSAAYNQQRFKEESDD